MNFDWILNPLTTYAVIGVALILTLVLFITSKLEIARAMQQARESQEAADRTIQEVAAGLEQLRTEVNSPAPASVPAAGPALNLTKRAQALRMLRRGESVESIASALRAPRNEVELLVKIQQLQGSSQA